MTCPRHWIGLIAESIIRVEQIVIVVDHADEGVVEGANTDDFVGLLDTWPENDRANSHSNVVGSHLVVWLILDELLEELNEELKGIVIQWVFISHVIKPYLDEFQILFVRLFYLYFGALFKFIVLIEWDQG